MPVKRVYEDGKYGYKWGEHGHVYFGPDAKKKAEEQGRAIEASKHSKKK